MQFVLAEVGADNCALACGNALIEQTVKGGVCQISRHFGAQIVQNQQVGGEHAVYLDCGIAVVEAGKALFLKGLEGIAGRLIHHAEALFGYHPGYAGGEIGLAQTGAAPEQQIYAAGCKMLGIGHAGGQHHGHALAGGYAGAGIYAVIVVAQVKILKSLA